MRAARQAGVTDRSGTAGPDMPDRRTAWLAALLAAACLPLERLFVDLDFVVGVGVPLACSLSVAWAARRLRLPLAAAVTAGVAGYALYCGQALLGHTLVAGLLPGRLSVQAWGYLWDSGWELVAVRQAPTFVEPGLLLLTATAVWGLALTADCLLHRARAPVATLGLVVTTWAVPLVLTRPGGTSSLSVTLVLACAAGLLHTTARLDAARWGRWVRDRRSARRGPLERAAAGPALACLAIVVGLLSATVLPGWGSSAWLSLRGMGTTTLSADPMVDLRAGLVAADASPLLHVRTRQPVYLRTTSLDAYSEREEWTNGGVQARDVGTSVPVAESVDEAQHVTVDVTVDDMAGGRLVPVPYQARAVTGPAAGRLLYDPELSTFTLPGVERLPPGSAYTVAAAVPAPDLVDIAARATPDPTGGRLTALPGELPEAVGDLAADIVADAGAVTPFERAMAIQSHLRGWEYSTEPPPGHSGSAMEAFLERRSGYCEQFAATMAVMLRTLGIPARVAIGFTPGARIGRDEYVVSSADAHAWVEVLFPGYGWISFEPTPRSDGNVLVPTAVNLAPTQTVAEAGAGGSTVDDFLGLGSLTGPRAIASAERELMRGVGDTVGGAAAVPAARGWTLVTGSAVAAAVALAWRRRRRSGSRHPGDDDVTRQRVEQARARVARVGRGLGRGPARWETDAEYLRRLGAGDPAAARLLTALSRGRYAADIPPEVAHDAETSASAVARALLQELPWARRGLVRARGALAAVLSVAVSAPPRADQVRGSSLRRPSM